MFSMFDKGKTFKPSKKQNDAKRQTLSEFTKRSIMATLNGGQMSEAVVVPPGEDKNEWIAVNTVDFFNEINLLYGTIHDVCTAETCPQMSAGKDYKYLWADGVKVKKPINVPARDYVELLMSWAEDQINDEALFPLESGGKFPSNFMKRVKDLYRRFFRVYAHIYHHHFASLQALGAEAHLNTCFKHFLYFVQHFELIDKKELAPLDPLIAKFTEQGDEKTKSK